MKVWVQPRTAGPLQAAGTSFPCCALGFGRRNARCLSLSESSPVPPPRSQTPDPLGFPLLDPQPGNRLRVGAGAGLSSLLASLQDHSPRRSRPVSGNNRFRAFVCYSIVAGNRRVSPGGFDVPLKWRNATPGFDECFPVVERSP